MPGLMARILTRRADGAPPEVPPAADAAPVADAPPDAPVAQEGPSPLSAEPVTSRTEPVANGSESVTQVLEPTGAAPAGHDGAEALPVTAEALPAAAEPAPDPAPTFRTRGPLRRRLRYLRRVRELGFRDLGGLVFDLDRFDRQRPELVRAKLGALRAIDAELRTLEAALHDERAVEELHEPGVSACVHCGALHGSEARFCPACGVAVRASGPQAPLEMPVAAPPAPAAMVEAEPAAAEPAPEQPAA